MISHTYSTTGVILRRRNFGEADRLLTIYTQRLGKLTAIAKGVRKLTSRKKAAIELFTHAKLFFAKGKNLDILTQADIIDGFQPLRSSLHRASLAYQVAETLDRLTRDGQDHPQVFHLLLDTLKKLSLPATDLHQAIFNYQVNLLKLLGFGLPTPVTSSNLTHHIESIIDKEIQSPKILSSS